MNYMKKFRPRTDEQRLRTIAHNQVRYMASQGGAWGLREGDETYNKFNRMIVKAYSKIHHTFYKGCYNLYGKEREDFVAGKGSSMKEYRGEQVYNFDLDFIVPVQDETLDSLLRTYNDTWQHESRLALLEKIIARIYAIGGESFIWK